MFVNGVYPGKSLKMRFLSPGKPWNLVFASPGKQCFNVCTNTEGQNYVKNVRTGGQYLGGSPQKKP